MYLHLQHAYLQHSTKGVIVSWKIKLQKSSMLEQRPLGQRPLDYNFHKVPKNPKSTGNQGREEGRYSGNIRLPL